MGQLVGLQAYLHEAYGHSVFDQALASRTPWTLHLHVQRLVQVTIVENLIYDLHIDEARLSSSCDIVSMTPMIRPGAAC